MAGLDFSHRAVPAAQAGAPNFAARATAQPIGVGEDVARSLPTGLAEGLTTVAGQFGDLQNLGRAGYDKLASYARDHGFNMPSAAQLQQTAPPNLGTVLGAATGAMAKRLGMNPQAARLATAVMTPGAIGAAPSSGQLLAAATRGQPLYQPQTTPGKYARTIAQFAPAAALPTSAASLPGQVARRALNVVAPAVASETAGQLTAGTPYEPWARAAGGIGAGALSTILTQPRPATRMLSQALEGASDEQIQQAQALMQDAQARGVPLTSAEAIQQVTGNGTGMGRLQRVLEGTRVGEQRFGPMMAARPDQVRQAVLDYADTVAPPTDQPSMIGVRAQQAAQAGLDETRQAINAVANPHYEALAGTVQPANPMGPSTAPRYVPGAGTVIPEGQYADLANNRAYQTALGEVRGNDLLNAGIAHLPDNDLSVVNEVVKHLDRNAQAYAQTATNPNGNNAIAGLFQAARNKADQIASGVSDQWRAARDTVSTGRELGLNPLEAGPLGSIASTQEVKPQTSALYPTQPLEGAPAETARAIQVLGGVNPTIAPDLTRQHLVNTLNEATQNLQSGPNQWGGAKYAAVIAGNPEQRATLLSGADAAGADGAGLARLLDVLDATGKRQAQGSRTAFNTQDLASLGSMGAAGHVVDTVLDPPGIFDKLGHAYERWQTNQNSGALADALLAQPDSVAAALLRARQLAPQNLGLLPSIEYGVLGNPAARGGGNAP